MLTEKKKELLRELVDRTCEECHKPESEVGTLWIHHINRKMSNGSDNHRNLKAICRECSKKYHFGEFNK